MGIIRGLMKKDSILENNMVQTIGSAGESLAAGAIFTLPAVFMWMSEGADIKLDVFATIAICLSGGILGVMFMIPLRQALIVKEHATLPYPEGTACAEVLVAGEEGGAAAGTVFAGLGIGTVYKFVSDGLLAFPSEIATGFKKFKGAGIGMDVLPSLLGVGYICGPRVASYMFSGGVLAWFVIMPLIAAFGGDTIMAPGTVPISEMAPAQIWSSYVKYIGAGAVAAGGIISLIKSMPLIVKTVSDNFKSLKEGSKNKGVGRTQTDLSMKTILIAVVAVVLVLVLMPDLPFNILSVLLIIVFGFFFATVSARMVGLVGSSNNPVSGMTIAALMITTAILKATGNTGTSGMVAAIMIGTVICIVSAMAGDISQDLKTGYIVGATPKKQQIGEIVGAVAAGFAITGILFLFNAAWSYGSEQLPAPQATLMKMVVEGVMDGNLPWNFVFAGIAVAVVMEILGISPLPVAIGLYLPIYISLPIMIGGLVRLFVERKFAKDEEGKKGAVTRGTLYASGLIAGEGIVGILLALFAVIPVGDGKLADVLNLSAKGFSLGAVGSLIFFALLIASLFRAALGKKKAQS